MLLNCVFFIDYSPKKKRQRNVLNFLHKIPRTESSVEEATKIATDDIHPSLMNNADATSASDMSTVNTVSPADQTDATTTSDKCITNIGAEFVILPGMRKLYDVKIKTLPFDCL